MLISKLDTIEEDEKADIQGRITTDACESLNIERDRIFPIINFLPSDRDESHNMKPVLKKQKLFVDNFVQILAPIATLDWAEHVQEKSQGNTSGSTIIVLIVLILAVAFWFSEQILSSELGGLSPLVTRSFFMLTYE